MRHVLMSIPLLLLAANPSSLANESPKSVAMLTGFKGKVELVRKGAAIGFRPAPQQLLYKGDMLQVGEGAFAEVLFFADGRAERLAEKSKAEVGRKSLAVRAGTPPDVLIADGRVGRWAKVLKRSAESLKAAPGQRPGALRLRGAKPKWLMAAENAAKLLDERGAHCTCLLLEGVAYYEADFHRDARNAFEKYIHDCESSPLIHRTLANLYEVEAVQQRRLADDIEAQHGKR